MFAQLPVWLRDLVDAWPLVLGIIAGVSWARRRENEWIKKHVADPIAAIQADVTETRHLVTYHLGPNGGAKPLHNRVEDLEAKVCPHE